MISDFPLPLFLFSCKKEMYVGIVDCWTFQGFRKVYNLSGGIHAYAVQVDPSVPTYWFTLFCHKCSPLLFYFPSLYMRARFCGMSMLPLGIGILLVWTCIYFGSRVWGYISSASFCEACLGCEVIYDFLSK